MTVNKNDIDAQINEAFEKTKQELKSIEEDQKEIDKKTWQTTCRFSMNNKNVNIQVINDKKDLIKATSFILSQFNAFDSACEALGVNKTDFEDINLFQNYKREEWLSDLKKSFMVIDVKQRKEVLLTRFEGLKEILSPEQLRQLRFQEIMGA